VITAAKIRGLLWAESFREGILKAVDFQNAIGGASTNVQLVGIYAAEIFLHSGFAVAPGVKALTLPEHDALIDVITARLNADPKKPDELAVACAAAVAIGNINKNYFARKSIKELEQALGVDANGVPLHNTTQRLATAAALADKYIESIDAKAKPPVLITTLLDLVGRTGDGDRLLHFAVALSFARVRAAEVRNGRITVKNLMSWMIDSYLLSTLVAVRLLLNDSATAGEIKAYPKLMDNLEALLKDSVKTKDVNVKSAAEDALAMLYVAGDIDLSTRSGAHLQRAKEKAEGIRLANNRLEDIKRGTYDNASMISGISDVKYQTKTLQAMLTLLTPASASLAPQPVRPETTPDVVMKDLGSLVKIFVDGKAVQCSAESETEFNGDNTKAVRLDVLSGVCQVLAGSVKGSLSWFSTGIKIGGQAILDNKEIVTIENLRQPKFNKDGKIEIEIKTNGAWRAVMFDPAALLAPKPEDMTPPNGGKPKFDEATREKLLKDINAEVSTARNDPDISVRLAASVICGQYAAKIRPNLLQHCRVLGAADLDSAKLEAVTGLRLILSDANVDPADRELAINILIQIMNYNKFPASANAAALAIAEAYNKSDWTDYENAKTVIGDGNEPIERRLQAAAAIINKNLEEKADAFTTDIQFLWDMIKTIGSDQNEIQLRQTVAVLLGRVEAWNVSHNIHSYVTTLRHLSENDYFKTVGLETLRILMQDSAEVSNVIKNNELAMRFYDLSIQKTAEPEVRIAAGNLWGIISAETNRNNQANLQKFIDAGGASDPVQKYIAYSAAIAKGILTAEKVLSGDMTVEELTKDLPAKLDASTNPYERLALVTALKILTTPERQGIGSGKGKGRGAEAGAPLINGKKIFSIGKPQADGKKLIETATGGTSGSDENICTSADGSHSVVIYLDDLSGARVAVDDKGTSHSLNAIAKDNLTALELPAITDDGSKLLGIRNGKYVIIDLQNKNQIHLTTSYSNRGHTTATVGENLSMYFDGDTRHEIDKLGPIFVSGDGEHVVMQVQIKGRPAGEWTYVRFYLNPATAELTSGASIGFTDGAASRLKVDGREVKNFEILSLDTSGDNMLIKVTDDASKNVFAWVPYYQFTGPSPSSVEIHSVYTCDASRKVTVTVKMNGFDVRVIGSVDIRWVSQDGSKAVAMVTDDDDKSGFHFDKWYAQFDINKSPAALKDKPGLLATITSSVDTAKLKKMLELIIEKLLNLTPKTPEGSGHGTAGEGSKTSDTQNPGKVTTQYINLLNDMSDAELESLYKALLAMEVSHPDFDEQLATERTIGLVIAEKVRRGLMTFDSFKALIEPMTLRRAPNYKIGALVALAEILDHNYKPELREAILELSKQMEEFINGYDALGAQSIRNAAAVVITLRELSKHVGKGESLLVAEFNSGIPFVQLGAAAALADKQIAELKKGEPVNIDPFMKIMGEIDKPHNRYAAAQQLARVLAEKVRQDNNKVQELVDIVNNNGPDLTKNNQYAQLAALTALRDLAVEGFKFINMNEISNAAQSISIQANQIPENTQVAIELVGLTWALAQTTVSSLSAIQNNPAVNPSRRLAAAIALDWLQNDIAENVKGLSSTDERSGSFIRTAAVICLRLSLLPTASAIPNTPTDELPPIEAGQSYSFAIDGVNKDLKIDEIRKKVVSKDGYRQVIELRLAGESFWRLVVFNFNDGKWEPQQIYHGEGRGYSPQQIIKKVDFDLKGDRLVRKTHMVDGTNLDTDDSLGSSTAPALIVALGRNVETVLTGALRFVEPVLVEELMGMINDGNTTALSFLRKQESRTRSFVNAGKVLDSGLRPSGMTKPAESGLAQRLFSALLKGGKNEYYVLSAKEAADRYGDMLNAAPQGIRLVVSRAPANSVIDENGNYWLATYGGINSAGERELIVHAALLDKIKEAGGERVLRLLIEHETGERAFVDAVARGDWQALAEHKLSADDIKFLSEYPEMAYEVYHRIYTERDKDLFEIADRTVNDAMERIFPLAQVTGPRALLEGDAGRDVLARQAERRVTAPAYIKEALRSSYVAVSGESSLEARAMEFAGAGIRTVSISPVSTPSTLEGGDEGQMKAEETEVHPHPGPLPSKGEGKRLEEAEGQTITRRISDGMDKYGELPDITGTPVVMIGEQSIPLTVYLRQSNNDTLTPLTYSYDEKLYQLSDAQKEQLSVLAPAAIVEWIDGNPFVQEKLGLQDIPCGVHVMSSPDAVSDTGISALEQLQKDAPKDTRTVPLVFAPQQEVDGNKALTDGWQARARLVFDGVAAQKAGAARIFGAITEALETKHLENSYMKDTMLSGVTFTSAKEVLENADKYGREVDSFIITTMGGAQDKAGLKQLAEAARVSRERGKQLVVSYKPEANTEAGSALEQIGLRAAAGAGVIVDLSGLTGKALESAGTWLNSACIKYPGTVRGVAIANGAELVDSVFYERNKVLKIVRISPEDLLSPLYSQRGDEGEFAVAQPHSPKPLFKQKRGEQHSQASNSLGLNLSVPAGAKLWLDIGEPQNPDELSGNAEVSAKEISSNAAKLLKGVSMLSVNNALAASLDKDTLASAAGGSLGRQMIAQIRMALLNERSKDPVFVYEKARKAALGAGANRSARLIPADWNSAAPLYEALNGYRAGKGFDNEALTRLLPRVAGENADFSAGYIYGALESLAGGLIDADSQFANPMHTELFMRAVVELQLSAVSNGKKASELTSVDDLTKYAEAHAAKKNGDAAIDAQMAGVEKLESTALESVVQQQAHETLDGIWQAVREDPSPSTIELADALKLLALAERRQTGMDERVKRTLARKVAPVVYRAIQRAG
jgi:hypothetical protein